MTATIFTTTLWLHGRSFNVTGTRADLDRLGRLADRVDSARKALAREDGAPLEPSDYGRRYATWEEAWHSLDDFMRTWTARGLVGGAPWPPASTTAP